MNRINFLGKVDFPNSLQTMDMLQGIAHLGCKTAAQLGGDNYILSGCINHDGIVSDGIIVIEGVPYVFEGGNKKDKVSIKEFKETLMAFGEEFPEARTICTVVFSDNGPYNWADFKQVLTNKELEKLIESIKGTPLGIPEMYVGYLDKIPENYKLCNGDYLSKDAFPELYNVIGTIHGFNSHNNFALPDMRQMFIVGYDNRHDDYKAIGKGKGKGLEKVTLVADELPEHDHTDRERSPFNKLSARAGDINEQATPGSIDKENAAQEYNVGIMTEPRWEEATIKKVGGNVAHENRPPFFTVAYIMKVKN